MRALLESVGFTFHSGKTNDRAEQRHAHWYCWCGPDGNWDVESGDYHGTEDAAIEEALARYIAFNEGVRAAILEEQPEGDEPDMEDYDDMESASNRGMEWATWEAWTEACRIVRDGADDRVLPPRPSDPVGIVRDALRTTRAVLDDIEANVAYGDAMVAESQDACTNALAVLPYLTPTGGRQ